MNWGSSIYSCQSQIPLSSEGMSVCDVHIITLSLAAGEQASNRGASSQKHRH